MRNEVLAALLEDFEPVRFRFGRGSPVFSGHFPGAPIVPGVFLIEVVRTAVERRIGRRMRVDRARELKLRAPIRPDTTVAVTLDCAGLQAEMTVRAIFSIDAVQVASLEVVLCAATEDAAAESKDIDR
jgi:3-hydroxyacyl-[acyl-carrier-protein] dehydratase